MWIFSVRLFKCRVLEETVTAGMVSLIIWLLWVWLFWHLLLILRNFLFPEGVGLPPWFLLCVRVRRPRAFGFYGSGLLLFFLSFLGVWVLFLVCVYSSFSCVVHSGWCRIIESLCLGPLHFLWFFTRICVVLGALPPDFALFEFVHW